MYFLNEKIAIKLDTTLSFTVTTPDPAFDIHYRYRIGASLRKAQNVLSVDKIGEQNLYCISSGAATSAN